MRFGNRVVGAFSALMINRCILQGSDWWKFSIRDRVMGSNQFKTLRNVSKIFPCS